MNTFQFICVCLGVVPAQRFLTDNPFMVFRKRLIAKPYIACNCIQFYVFIYKKMVNRNVWKGIRLWSMYFSWSFRVQSSLYLLIPRQNLDIYIDAAVHLSLKVFESIIILSYIIYLYIIFERDIEISRCLQLFG